VTLGRKLKIKPVGYLKTTKTSKSHIPEIIRRETSVEPGGRIPYLIDANAVLLFNPDVSAEELIESLEVLKRDVLLRSLRERKVKPREGIIQ